MFNISDATGRHCVAEVKGTDEKQEFETGASRSLVVGRGLPSLMPWDAFREKSRIMEQGAAVHAPRNWEKGIPESNYLDSLVRHLQLYVLGCNKEPHLSQISWNADCWLATRLRIEAGLLPAELRDIPGLGHGILPPYPVK